MECNKTDLFRRNVCRQRQIQRQRQRQRLLQDMNDHSAVKIWRHSRQRRFTNAKYEFTILSILGMGKRFEEEKNFLKLNQFVTLINFPRLIYHFTPRLMDFHRKFFIKNCFSVFINISIWARLLLDNVNTGKTPFPFYPKLTVPEFIFPLEGFPK